MSSPRKLGVALAVSVGGLAFIAAQEGRVNAVYLDAVGIPTVCVGHTATAGRYTPGQRIPDDVCDLLLRQDSKSAASAVGRLVKVPITQGQFDALVSLVFNIGPGAFARSTLLKRLNTGDCIGAGQQFLLWDKAGGKIIRGLSSRRAKEAAMFTAGCPS